MKACYLLMYVGIRAAILGPGGGGGGGGWFQDNDTSFALPTHIAMRRIDLRLFHRMITGIGIGKKNCKPTVSTFDRAFINGSTAGRQSTGHAEVNHQFNTFGTEGRELQQHEARNQVGDLNGDVVPRAILVPGTARL